MAQYIFSDRRRNKKSWRWVEFSLWFGIFVYFTFLYFAWVNSKDFKALFESSNFMIFSFLLFVLLVYFPSKRSMRLQKNASTVIDTSRKGMHYKDFQQNKLLAWRDIDECRIVLDIHPASGIYPREFIFKHSKGRIHITNDPAAHKLEGALELLAELHEKLPELKESFVSFRNFCPYCSKEKEGKKIQCSCGNKVTFVHKLLRPHYLMNTELIFVVMATFILGGIYLPIGLALLTLFLLTPYLLMRKRRFNDINTQLEELRRSADSVKTEQQKGDSEGSKNTSGTESETPSSDDETSFPDDETTSPVSEPSSSEKDTSSAVDTAPARESHTPAV